MPTYTPELKLNFDAEKFKKPLDTGSMNKSQMMANTAQQLSTSLGVKPGGVTSGAIQGAQLGASTGNPYVSAIGGVVGGVAGGLQANIDREQYNRQVEAGEVASKDKAQQQASMDRRNTLRSLASNLSQTLLS